MTMKKQLNSKHFNFKDRVGEVFLNKEGCEFEIIKYNNNRCCDIIFKDKFSQIRRCIPYSRLVTGDIKNYYNPIINGVGYFGEGIYNSKCNSYPIWKQMLERAYSKEYHIKKPTYTNITVCEEWHNFQVFAKWFEENYILGFELDKDILCPTCKIYSPETCCFVPQEINSIFTNSKSYRGKYPKGVTKVNNLFSVRLVISGKAKRLGFYKSVDEAFNVYKIAKEKEIKRIADKWKGRITEEVYNIMYNHQVKITD